MRERDATSKPSWRAISFTMAAFSGSPPAKLIEKGMEMRYGKPAYVFDQSAALKQTLARAQEEDTRERIFASLFHMSGGFYGFGRESDRAAVRLAASAMPERDVAWKTKESAVRLTMPGGSNAQVVASSLKLGPLLAKQYEEDVKAALQK